MARILLATDGSALATEAARRGLALLDPAAEVTLACVAHVPVTALAAPGVGVGRLPAEVLDPDAMARARDEAQAIVDSAAASLGIDAHRVVLDGEPGDAICRYAGEGDFDLVVVGSHGSGFVKRVLMGSVSHHVLHHAPCPVLVVRHRDDTED